MSKPSINFDHKHFLKSVPTLPGVYEMYSSKGGILYVGKAINLKKRLASYFSRKHDSSKVTVLVEKIYTIDFTITHSESEALILEQNLIKEKQPPYNVLLRDDKSYPFIFLSDKDEYPRLAFHRGAKRKKGRYFGPYPSSSAVRESLYLLQKAFRVRQCDDSYFNNRSRPCLQYQIDRCSGPCTRMVSKADYAQSVHFTELFLMGKSDEIKNDLIKKMDSCSVELDFENAASYRDQVAMLTKIQEQQIIDNKKGNVDVVALVLESGMAAFHVFFIRQGRMLGSRNYFPKISSILSKAEILQSFLSQYYLMNSQLRDAPDEIISNIELVGFDAFVAAYKSCYKKTLSLHFKVRGHRLKWVELAEKNAKQSLTVKLADKNNMRERYESLQLLLALKDLPHRLECFDISHHSGEATVASCVVFDSEGPLTSDYRIFNISDITPGDDYAAMKQAITRRYIRVAKGEYPQPDVLIIDGGFPLLKLAREIVEELQLTEVTVISISKGVDRKAGLEILHQIDKLDVKLNDDSPALHLIQHIRDESHRFAIAGHRKKKNKQRVTSRLEGIPGVGAKKRKELLTHFGGLQGIVSVGVDDLERVNGISRALAETIYDYLH